MANASASTPTPGGSSDLVAPAPMGPAAKAARASVRVERSLNELRSARRLEKAAASIESFLLSQIARVNKSLDLCKSAGDQNQVVRRILADFETQKGAWERERQAEIQRFYEASEQLAKGWKQLEEERQAWLAVRPAGLSTKPS